jgi:hypothetical protein
MKLKNICLFLLTVIGIFSCGNPDDNSGLVAVDPLELSEVVTEDDELIVAYLKSHFYNYEEFQNPTADFDYRIKFDTIAGENADKISIFDSGSFEGVEFGMETISVLSEEVLSSSNEVVDHNLYYLVARQGVSETTPTIGDNTNVRYEGSLLTGEVFDSSVEQPIQFNLSRVVRGFGNGLEYFKSGTGPIENGDGTFTFENYGVGAIFMPSGLAYFNTPDNSIIPLYAPLVFKVELFSFEKDSDFDSDGIPSFMEDLNMDGNLNNDNTDDEDEINTFSPNYADTDDDNDGILTIDEINLNEDGSFLSFRDTDGDGIYDHLDDN